MAETVMHGYTWCYFPSLADSNYKYPDYNFRPLVDGKLKFVYAICSPRCTEKCTIRC
jgi:hypothetical protein